MAVVLALITAGLWGTSDFFGGLATRQQSVARVMLWVHGIGLVAVAAAAPFIADSVGWRDLWIGVIAGIVGLIGLLLLYWSLSVGPMSVVAPLSAVTAALLPVLWGLSGSGSLSTLTAVGLAVGLAAVVAISWEGSPGDDSPDLTPVTIASAIIAGLCFGSILLLYNATDEASAPWPIVSGRLVTTALLLIFALSRRQPITPGPTLKFAAIAGLGDTFANVTLLAATASAIGDAELSVVAVVSAFYPAATVIWARISLREALGPIRIVGLALGFTAIALMTIG